MNRELLNIFAECTEAIELDLLTIDDCLSLYPQYRDELSEMLEVVVAAKQVPFVELEHHMRRQVRQDLLETLPPKSRLNGVNGTHKSVEVGLPTQAHALGLQTQLEAVRKKLTIEWRLAIQRSVLSLGATTVSLVLVTIIAVSLLRSPYSFPLEQVAVVNQEVDLLISAEATPTLKSELANSSDKLDLDPLLTQPSVIVAEALDNPTGQPAESEVALATEPGVMSDPNQPVEALIETAASSALPQFATTEDSVLNGAVLSIQNGFAEIKAGAGEWEKVQGEVIAKVGQRIRTGRDSNVSLAFADGSRAVLGPFTEVSLDMVEMESFETDGRHIVMTQWEGATEHFVQMDEDDASSAYEVLTPNGSGRATNTVFQVVVTTGESSEFVVVEGEMDLTHQDVSVTVQAGQTGMVSDQKPPEILTTSNTPAMSGVGESEDVGETGENGPETGK